MDGLLIENVVPGSIADELELEGGDRLVAINGHRLRDIIDYNFYGAETELTLEIVRADGEAWEIEVERGEDEPLGLVFPAPKPMQCGNKCLFCFVHQLPKGLRPPLYVKDEDYRLSFLYGNSVTLANIGPAELQRIKEQRLSPLYLSVHATDPALREKLLGTAGIIPVLDIMRELAANRITMHTQVVLCPGLNDGAALEQTVSDLVALQPQVASLAIVPVGITSHRNGLPPLQPVTREYAARFIENWYPRGRELARQLGRPFLYLADEFFIKGELPFPPLEEYGDLPQIENGVGMIPLFLEEAREVLNEAVRLDARTVTVITGESPYHYLASFLQALSRKTGVNLVPVAVRNRLFGDNVTVTGLVAGRDIVEALRGCELGTLVIVPDVMLKEGEGVFLDDLGIDELQKELGCAVLVAESTPWGLYNALREKGA